MTSTSVLHVIPAVAARYGGPSRAVLGYVRHLRAAGMDAKIATTDAEGAGRLDVPKARFVDFEGAPTIFFAREWSESFKYSRSLGRWLADHVADFDVVHIHAVFSHSSLSAARACRDRGVPYVVRPLGSLGEWALARRGRAKLLLWSLSGRRMMHEAAAVHYTTTEERRQAERRLGLKRGAVIPIGIDDRGEDDGPGSNGEAFRRRFGLAAEPYVLSLARLHPVKRLDLLVEAFCEATATNDLAHWRLVLAGEGERRHAQALQDLVHARGMGNRVVFPGWLDGRGTRDALDGAALLALLSHQESFGIAALEALARGVPVFVSPEVGLASDIEKSQAGWVTNGDPTNVARSLREALSSPTERATRGNAGTALVRDRFSWPRVADDLAQLYAEVRSEGRRA